MAQNLLEGAQHYLTFTQVHDQTDTLLRPFLNACEHNDAILALQLAPNRDAGALTVGLNNAVRKSHLELARKLLGMGAKIDAMTVHEASRSLEAIKLLIEFGFDVNTSLIRGGTLLP